MMNKRIRYSIYLALIVATFTASAFNYDLSFRGMDSAFTKRIGCACEVQDDMDYFYSKYSSDVARIAHHRYDVRAGVIRKNSTSAKGFLGSFSNLNIAGYSSTTAVVDRFVIFVNWPEFGE